MNCKRDADHGKATHVSHCILLAKTVLKNFGRNTVCITATHSVVMKYSITRQYIVLAINMQ